MSHSIHVVIQASTKENAALFSEKLKKQSVKIDQISSVMFSDTYPIKSLLEVMKNVTEDLLLILPDRAEIPSDYIEKMSFSFADSEVSVVCPFIQFKKKSLSNVFMEELHNNHQDFYTIHDLYSAGIYAFLFPYECMMVRVSDFKNLTLPVYSLTDPGVLIAASMIYSDKKVVFNKNAVITLDKKISGKDLSTFSYDLGLSEKVHTELLGVGINVTKTRKNISLDGKKTMLSPIINNEMKKVYSKTFKAASKRLNVFQKIGLLCLKNSMTINDFLGQHYHRIPLFISKMNTGHKDYFN